jgi:predicted CXXCH cytochrome family protein
MRRLEVCLVTSLAFAACSPERGRVVQPPLQADLPEGFAGSAACQGCHPAAFETWQKSVHNRHMAAPDPDFVVGDFEHDNVYELAGTRSRMYRDPAQGGRYFMEYTDADGERTTHAIDWALGQTRHQVYLTRMDDGRLQVLPTYWNVEEGHWRDATEGAIDGKPPIARSDRNHWRNHTRTFNLSCLECHGSQGRKNYDPVGNRYDSPLRPSIDCEACHGPALEHVERWVRLEGQVRADRDDGLPHLGGMGWQASVEVCSSCHAKKKVYASGYTPRAAFYDFFMPDVWEADGYFVDGRSRNLNYRFVDFMQNSCSPNAHRRLDCGSCHPPHDLESARGKSVDQQNALCTGCHLSYGNALSEHTHHKRASGQRLHRVPHAPMPLGLRMTVRDHSIGSPLPELTRLYGIPNACSNCHADRPQDTLEADMERFWGGRESYRAFVSHGDAGARACVDARVQGLGAGDRRAGELAEGHLAERGAAGERGQLMGVSAGVPAATAALLEAVNEPHPSCGSTLVLALGQSPDPRARAALEKSLGDPMRSIRVRAFESLETARPRLRVGRAARGGQSARRGPRAARRDPRRRPGAEVRAGARLFYQGRAAEAEALLRRLVTIAPRIPGYRADLAQYLVASERFDEAARVSEDVLRLDPGNLGATLAMAEIHLRRGRPAETLRLLDTLAPDVRGAAPVQSLRAAAAARVPAAP